MLHRERRILIPAFTLVELLIVIAIIAILALIALPNFFAAQTRAKVVRARSDMRSICAGLEAYFGDYGRYPPPKSNQGWFFSRFRLTTPIAYIAGGGAFVDPFGAPLSENLETGNFVYQKLPGLLRLYAFNELGNCTDANDERILYYVLASNAPDHTRFEHVGARISNSDTHPSDFADILAQVYDPTNGTMSVGELLRFGASAPEGAFQIARIAAGR